MTIANILKKLQFSAISEPRPGVGQVESGLGLARNLLNSYETH